MIRFRRSRHADVALHGDGHTMMLEKNSSAIAAEIARWLGERWLD
jgi:hypothetical protein